MFHRPIDLLVQSYNYYYKLARELCKKEIRASLLLHVILCEFFDYSKNLRIFAPENKNITIMTQILVTLNEDATTLHVRKAIELLRGVVSTTVFKTKDDSNKKTLRQQAYVKESLERAFDEMKLARREGRKLQSADDFIKELEAEESI